MFNMTFAKSALIVVGANFFGFSPMAEMTEELS